MQTAVDFLVKEFSTILGPLTTQPMQDMLLFDAIQKAKQMEKNQIIDAICLSEYENEIDRSIGEQYYNETYGSKGSDETKTS